MENLFYEIFFVRLLVQLAKEDLRLPKKYSKKCQNLRPKPTLITNKIANKDF